MTATALTWQYARNRSNAGVWDYPPKMPVFQSEEFPECIFFDDGLAVRWRLHVGVLFRWECSFREAREWAAAAGLPLVIEGLSGRYHPRYASVSYDVPVT